MEEIQRFALEKIYCAPSQDRQFSFNLVRVTKKDFPVKRSAVVYGVSKYLPGNNEFYHVFLIGNLSPTVINLLKQKREWFRDKWINVEEDMNSRNFILQLYNEDGVMYPRKYLYYSFIDEGTILVAMQITQSLRRNFEVETFKYLRVYSNTYFNSKEFNTASVRHGIKCHVSLVDTNADKVAIQNQIISYEKQGGGTFIYVNGYYTDNLNLNIPNNSYIEILYDQSILSKEKFPIATLRTFESTKDNRVKYLLFRTKRSNRIQYDDDNEIYISTQNELVTKGVFFYSHRDYAIRNVTDKDYSLYTAFVNNQASRLSGLTTGSVQDKQIILYTRKSGLTRELIYSSLKLHELYKLPENVEKDVLSNMNFTIPELRAEYLENSDYFTLTSIPKLNLATKELATNAVGYNGVTYYYGNSPVKRTNTDLYVNVPHLYRTPSYAYEYDEQGKLAGQFITDGPIYIVSNASATHVEFIKGTTPVYFDKLYSHDETISVRNSEYRLLSTYYNGVTRLTGWEDVTSLYSKSNGAITLNEISGKKVKIVYLDQPLTYDLELSLVDGVLYFPLSVKEDRGTGIQKHSLDLPYRNIEVFLNGHRLTYQVDFFIEFPYIGICNKTYLDYSTDKQRIHIRAHGFTLDKEDINKLEINGFVNNGVLARNNLYDIRDDRVFSVFIKGKLYDRSQVIWSEEDNSVRTTHPLNGYPYTISEPLIPIKEITGLDTLPYFNKNLQLNKSIANLYNLIFPEPKTNTFNVISGHHYLYSCITSKIIYDMLDGNIPSSMYMTPYNDDTILQLLNDKYRILYKLDPIFKEYPDNVVAIHPHCGNSPIELSLHQYRFITNVVRIITKGKPGRLNLSEFLTVTTTYNPDVVTTTEPKPTAYARPPSA